MSYRSPGARASYNGQSSLQAATKRSQSVEINVAANYQDVRGTGLASLVSGISSAMTTAKPASRCQSMWQWRNQGPGLFVYEPRVSGPAAHTEREEKGETHLKSDGDVVTGAPDVDDVTEDGVVVVVLRAIRASDDPEVMLEQAQYISVKCHMYPYQCQKHTPCKWMGCPPPTTPPGMLSSTTELGGREMMLPAGMRSFAF